MKQTADQNKPYEAHNHVLSSKKGDLVPTSAPSVLSFGFTGLNFSLSMEETKQTFAETSAEPEEASHMIYVP